MQHYATHTVRQSTRTRQRSNNRRKDRHTNRQTQFWDNLAHAKIATDCTVALLIWSQRICGSPQWLGDDHKRPLSAFFEFFKRRKKKDGKNYTCTRSLSKVCTVCGAFIMLLFSLLLFLRVYRNLTSREWLAVA